MLDGSGVLDNPTRIIVPTGSFESPGHNQEDPRREISKFYEAYLTMPQRLDPNRQNTTSKQLAEFLTDQGYIKSIKVQHRSWGFQYISDEKAVFISESEMPMSEYNYYIFRLGIDAQTHQSLWPQPDEMDQYRFLHEVSHAYQDYLINEEGSSGWYDRAAAGEIDSPFGVLFGYCYRIRSENAEKGLSTWGNQPDYNTITDIRSQNAIKALEDVNDFIVMHLWNPEYLNTYLSKEIPGYGEKDLEKDRLVAMPSQDKRLIKTVMAEYIRDMQHTISSV